MASVWAAEDELLGRQVAVKVLAPGYAADAVCTTPLRARGARRGEGVRPPERGDDLRRRRARRPGLHRDGATSPAAPSPTGCAGRSPCRAARRCAGWRAPRARSTTPTAPTSSTATSSPATCCSTSAGRIAVADFGIARIASDTAMTQTGPGARDRRVPLARAGARASRRPTRATAMRSRSSPTSCSRGRKPFDGEMPAAQARQHIESPVPPGARACARAVDDVLARGLAKDPADRPLTATAFVEDLRGALEDAPTAATAVASRRRRRRRRVQA